MSLYELFKRYATDTLSIMIIPHTGENIRQIKFKKIMFYTLITTMCSICIILAVLVYVLYDLNHELDTKINDLSKLQSLNMQQANEIQELKNKASIVNEKLSVLDELEAQVRNLMGLKSNTGNQITNSVSRSIIRQDYKLEISPSDSILTYGSDSMGDGVEDEDNIELLAANMDKEMENLNILIDEVTGELKIRDAKPDKTPALGRITSKFGYRKSPFTGKTQFHKGLDIANSKGTNIVAAGTGIVTFSGWNSGYGNTIIISHGYGYRSVYAHNKENLVKVGEKVSKGDVIAKMGSTGKSTGPHVHFEIHYQGKQIDPLTVLEN